jgi:UDP-N-acetylglucosamine 2-epimerase
VKVLTVLGTRPEIIRLSIIIEKLDDSPDFEAGWT